MKEFERWYNKYTTHVKANKGLVIDYFDTQVGWKAALKWVLKHDPDIGMASCIKRELEATE